MHLLLLKNKAHEVINIVLKDMKFTVEQDQKSSHFLNIPMQKKPEGVVETMFHRNNTSTDQILKIYSNHSDRHKMNCVKALFKRMNTQCSSTEAK